MPKKRVKRRKLSSSETFHQFLQLPLHDLMVPGISKYMDLKAIMNFRCCSRYCKELAESALAAHRKIEISSTYPEKSGAEVLFRVIVQHCRHLREIELSFLYWLTDEMLIQLFNNNPLLEVIRRLSCESLTPKALYPLVNCKNLTILQLLDGRGDDTFLEMLNQHEIQLEEVVFLGTSGFSEEGLRSFFRKQPRLKYIYLPGLESMFREILETIVESCQELRCLSLEHYDKYDHVEDVKWFLKATPKLEKIGIFETEDISDSLWDLLDEVNVSLDDTL